MAGSAFERYGGFAKVSRIVSAFYERVLDSDRLAPYFDGVDMRRLVDHQTKFIAFLMDGPASYTREHLERVHARLSITDEAFDEMVGLLRETFEDFDIDESDIATMHSRLVGYRGVVVSERGETPEPGEGLGVAGGT